MILGTTMSFMSPTLGGNVFGQQQTATLNVQLNLTCNPTTPACPPHSQFIIQVTNNNENLPPFQGSETPIPVTLSPGSYSVGVTSVPNSPEGYLFSGTFGPNCAGNIAAGQTLQCTLTAIFYIPTNLNVIKQVQCPTGSTCPPASAFTIRVSGLDATPNVFGGSATGTAVRLGPGSFSVTEVPPTVHDPPGLTLAPIFNNNCNGVITTGGQQLGNCIITNRYLPDRDGDRLADVWEAAEGVDWNNDGAIDLPLPEADVNRKNIYVETDYMQFHQPLDSAINNVISSFSAPPVTNPGQSPTGIILNVQVDEQIPHRDQISTFSSLGYKERLVWNRS